MMPPVRHLPRNGSRSRRLARAAGRTHGFRAGLPAAAAGVFLAAAAVGAAPPAHGAPAAASGGRKVLAAGTAELIQAFNDLQNGDTILLADGVYAPGMSLQVDGKTDIAIQGASRDPDRVVWRGPGWDRRDGPHQLLRIGKADGVDIGWITFEQNHMYGVKVEAESFASNVHIHHCAFRDIGVRHIKGSAAAAARAAGGSIRFCRFENTRIPPAHWQAEGNYITAIDMMALEDWVIADNTFARIKGRTGNARAAIFIWVRSRGVVVERNVIVDCDRGIAFGNPSGSTAEDKQGPPAMHVSDGICRNNVIVPGADAGIEIAWARNLKVYHNTVYRRDRPDGAHWWSQRGIRLIQRIDGVDVANNLVHNGTIHCEEPDGRWRSRGNLAGRFDGWFADPERGNLRLTDRAAQAVQAGERLPEAPTDIDNAPRGPKTTIGAWESGGN